MDKIIIVNYVGVGNMDPEDTAEFLESVAESLQTGDDEILNYVIPTRGETRIECINPKLVSPEDFEKAQRTLEECTRRVNEFIASFDGNLK